MRRNFVEVLRSGKVSLKKEYSKLYDLFYGKNEQYEKSLADFVSENFFAYHFRGTCLSLDEFDETYGFHFVEQPQNFDIDYLVSFCEYVYNKSTKLLKLLPILNVMKMDLLFLFQRITLQ